MDRLVNAGSAVLAGYASLTPAVARTFLSDNEARELREQTLWAAEQYNELATPTIYKLETRRKYASDVFHGMRSTASPDQLSKAASSVRKHKVACMEWWDKKARRYEQTRSVCAATINLPGTTAQMQQGQIALRLHAGWTLNLKIMQVQSRIDIAKFDLEPLASTCEAAAREILTGENGGLRLLGTFIGDVFPAFISTKDAVTKGRPLDAEHCAVLEGVVERLSEFGLALHDIVAKLRDERTGADLPLESLDQIVEEAWITAQEVMNFLALQPKPSASIASPADTGAAIPAAAARNAARAEGTAGRRKGKGKHKPAAAAESSARLPEPQVSAVDSDTRPAAKVLVRSDLGTKTLVSAEAANAVASAAAAHLAIWQAPDSKEALRPLLNRLDELLQFDLAGQQRIASEARNMKPEDAEHAVETIVKLLQTQAAEMDVCLRTLAEPRLLLLLTPAQMREMHDQAVGLKKKLSEARGVANSLNDRKGTIMMDCMKTSSFPSQKYLEHLRDANELTLRHVHSLRGGQGKLFEIELQPKALSNTAKSSPMWVHIHTNRPVDVRQLATLDDAEFAACHVKSDEQRGYNRQWLDARAAEGHRNFVIHRGELSAAFCKSLLNGSRHTWQAASTRSTP
ncbi:hypothetical protein QCM80_16270 [Bradyrhizobium sp. SSUT112]|uniref:hypothetical protein n=1 Tax=Bradyrhizobium sp. SSUT112 TaxID=3040604 RepID=UPI00244A9F79|nr:hypothetical protein [Bradyrhizobium sp. SSUT112]MDH2352199.1 hypothetical protein [Bradyrhizobium sp. SSUT112]